MQSESIPERLSRAAAQALGQGVLVEACMVGAASGPVFDVEELAVRAAVELRRQEFLTGRRLARAALTRLGFEPTPLLVGKDRAPRWPEGAIGSISHSRGLVMVAAAHGPGGIGLDLEPAEGLEPGLWPAILTAGEQQGLGKLATQQAWPPEVLVRALFSAKECYWKTISKGAQRLLDFKEVEIQLEGQGFFARCLLPELVDARCRELKGRLERLDGWLLATARLGFDPKPPA